ASVGGTTGRPLFRNSICLSEPDRRLLCTVVARVGHFPGAHNCHLSVLTRDPRVCREGPRAAGRAHSPRRPVASPTGAGPNGGTGAADRHGGDAGSDSIAWNCRGGS